MLDYHNTCVCEGAPWYGNIPVINEEGCSALPKESVIKDIRGGREKGNIALTGGEPLMHPDIMDFIFESACLGYRRIKLMTGGSRLADTGFLKSLIYAGVYLFEIPACSPDDLTKKDPVRSVRKSSEGLRNIRKIAELDTYFYNIYVALVLPVCSLNYGILEEILGAVIEDVKVDRVIFCWGEPGFDIRKAGLSLGGAIGKCVKNKIWAFTRGIPLCAIPGNHIYHMEELYVSGAPDTGFDLSGPCRECWARSLCRRLPGPLASFKYAWNPRAVEAEKYTPYVKDILEKGYVFDAENEKLYSS